MPTSDPGGPCEYVGRNAGVRGKMESHQWEDDAAMQESRLRGGRPSTYLEGRKSKFSVKFSWISCGLFNDVAKIVYVISFTNIFSYPVCSKQNISAS